MKKKGREEPPFLVTVGPTGPVPKGFLHCNACGGDGKDNQDRRRKCDVCRGKGHYSPADIDDRHARNRKMCREDCGRRHISQVKLWPNGYGETIKTARLRVEKTLDDIKKTYPDLYYRLTGKTPPRTNLTKVSKKKKLKPRN